MRELITRLPPVFSMDLWTENNFDWFRNELVWWFYWHPDSMPEHNSLAFDEFAFGKNFTLFIDQ